VGGRDDPVLKLDGAKPQWAEQMIEHRSLAREPGAVDSTPGSDVPPSSPQVRWRSSLGWPASRSPRAAGPARGRPVSRPSREVFPARRSSSGPATASGPPGFRIRPSSGRRSPCSGVPRDSFRPTSGSQAPTPTGIGSRSSSVRRGGGLQWPRVGREWGSHVRFSHPGCWQLRVNAGARHGELTLWVQR
jgi:hypothetical protein